MKERRPLRLRKRAEFLAMRNGEKRRGPHFLMEVRTRDHQDNFAPDKPARIGFTVSRKNGNAVKRNRIRRRLREAIRIHCKESLKAGVDYVIVARPDCITTPFDTLTRELQRRIEKKSERDSGQG